MSKSKKVIRKKTKSKPQPKALFKLDPNVKGKLTILLSLLFILIGAFFLTTYVSLIFPKQDFKFLSKVEKTENSPSAQTGSIRVDKGLMNENNASEPPMRVIMPTADIDLNVVEASVKNGFWETSDTTASHGMGSANPGKVGNSVIFAHARVGLFYNLKDVKQNDVIYVLTQKKWFAYKVSNITSVYPNQIEVIAPTKDETLTLYTCTGYADEKRLIVVAKPVKT